MRLEINQLRACRQHSEHIRGLLAFGNQSEIILQQIKNGVSLEESPITACSGEDKCQIQSKAIH